ncbi:MAG: NADH:flavin oxidoreductase [Bacteroidetes bacterium]|nr:MAG: NADH:flavin oxidoreductase [Bacteroidota bacterium]
MSRKAFTPINLRGLELKNRFIKTATFEGMSSNGVPDDRLFNLHASMAANDVALTTVAYGAVNEDGLTHEDQMVIDDTATPHLKRLADAVHEKDGKICIQLTHCGYFSRSTRYQSKKPLGPSRTLNKYGIMKGRPYSKAMSHDDIVQTVADFARAALVSQRCGFDAVEVHMGHGYLLSQFLSPAINRRDDNYGGSLENRMRISLEIIDAIREEVGENFPILCKINLEDDFNNGFTIGDCIEAVQMLNVHGVDAVMLSGGFTSLTPFYLMRGELPIKEMVESEKNYLQKFALRFFGRTIIKKYEFRENFFFDQALQVRKTTKMPLVYVGGIISSQGVNEVMHAGFDMIAIGRALIAEPDFVKKMQENPDHRSPCDQCNKCVGYIDKKGIECVL